MQIIKTIDLTASLSLVTSTDEKGNPIRFIMITTPVQFMGQTLEVPLVPKESLGKKLLSTFIETYNKGVTADGKRKD